MKSAFLAELVKASKRPATWVLVATWLVLMVLFSYALPYAGYLTDDGGPATAQAALREALPDQLVVNALSGTPVFGGAIVLIMGALMVGSEYGWGTLKTLLTQRPARLTVLGAKLAAVVAAALGVVLLTFVVGAVVGAVIGALESQPASWPGIVDILEGVATGWLITSMWALFGAALAFVFRSIALPIGLGVVWALGIENLVSSMADDLLTALRPLRDVLPGVNAGSLVSELTSGAQVGAPSPGVIAAVGGGRALLTLALYVVAFVAASALVLRRRDVS